MLEQEQRLVHLITDPITWRREKVIFDISYITDAEGGVCIVVPSSAWNTLKFNITSKMTTCAAWGEGGREGKRGRDALTHSQKPKYPTKICSLRILGAQLYVSLIHISVHALNPRISADQKRRNCLCSTTGECWQTITHCNLAAAWLPWCTCVASSM